MPVSRILWGPTFENELRIGFPLYDFVSDREERDGSEHVQSPAGVEDSWITGRDYVLDAEVRFIPDGPNTSPVQTQLSGANSWQAFLDYARDANALRFIPDETALDFYIDNVYLVEPRKGFGGLGPDIRRKARIKLRNATMDFHQALRGIMVQIQAGMSLTDPTVLTFTRADATTCATRIKRDGTIETVAANVLRIEWVDLDGDGVRETPGILLEGSRTNAFTFSEDFTNAVWTKLDAGDSVTPDATAGPDTVVSADKFVEGVANSQHGLLRNTPALTDNTKQPFTVFAKPAERSWVYLQSVDKSNTVRRTWFNVAAGTIGTTDAGHTVKITGPHNGFYRCQIIFDSSTGATAPNVRWVMATSDGVVNYAGSAGSGMYFVGAQFETDKIFPSSYIKTVASAVTRAADSLTLPFTFGPMDLTVLTRLARSNWMDVAGNLGTMTLVQLATANPILDYGFRNGVREFYSRITPSGGVISAAVPAGTALSFVGQVKNLKTAGQEQVDVGAGYGGFGAAEPGFAGFGNQTLRLNLPGNEFFGVVLELKIASGLRTLAQMLTA